MTWWITAAAAADLLFSPDGQRVTLRESYAHDQQWTARVETFVTGSGTWLHLPVSVSAPDEAAARQAAEAAATSPWVVRADGVKGDRLGGWIEGSRDHAHAGEHVVSWRLRLPDTVAIATLREAPSCGVGVEPWLTWQRGATAPVERLSDRNPRRWPACALSYEPDSAWLGPGGAVVMLLRTVVALGDDVVVTATLVTAR